MDKEASFTFTTPLNVNIVNLKGEEHLYVEGDISTNDIDFVNDIMTKNCQESMQRQILERNMKLDLEHEAFKGDTHEEKEINKTRIPAGKIIDATVKELGDDRYSTSVKCEINRHNPNYKSIKGNLVEKYLDAFSVAFLPTDISYEQQEGKAIRMLNDVILLNVAMTGNPCNTKAQMVEISTKSMDALEEYKKRKSLDPSVEGQLEVKARGEGQGVEGEKQGDGGAEYCKCPKCGKEYKKGKGKPCNEKMCPKCNIKLEGKSKSHSTVNSEDITKLHTKNSKMTEEENDKETESEEESEEEESENVEAKSVEMLKSISNELKSMKEAYEVVAKDNVSMKEELSKITDALKQPVHKSMNNNTDEIAKQAAKTEGKSVDPLELC